MSIAPHSGIIDFGTFTPPSGGQDGIQGEVPAPLAAEVSYILSATGWIPLPGGTGTVTSVSGTGTVNGIALTGTVTSSGSLTLGGTLSGVSLTTQVSGTLPIANGGTGATDASTARSNLSAAGSGAVTGTGITMSTDRILGRTSASTGAIEEISIGSGLSLSAGTLTATASGGTVTSVSGTGTVNGITLTGTVTSSGSLTLGGTLSGVSLTTQVSGTLPVGNGGTGATTLTGLVVGNGTSAFTAVTAPSGTVVGTTDTQTLTNKRLSPRINAQTTTSSPWAWNSDSYDQQSFSALANALTINADAGTPTDGQKAMFRFKDDGTARALTWTAGTSKSFRAIGVTLPTTTVANKTTYVGCIYNSADSRWDAVAVTTEA